MAVLRAGFHPLCRGKLHCSGLLIFQLLSNGLWASKARKVRKGSTFEFLVIPRPRPMDHARLCTSCRAVLSNIPSNCHVPCHCTDPLVKMAGASHSNTFKPLLSTDSLCNCMKSGGKHGSCTEASEQIRELWCHQPVSLPLEDPGDCIGQVNNRQPAAKCVYTVCMCMYMYVYMYTYYYHYHCHYYRYHYQLFTTIIITIIYICVCVHICTSNYMPCTVSNRGTPFQ